MKICFIALFYDTQQTDPSGYLDEVPLYRHLPQAVAARGHEVSVVHLFPVDASYREGGVIYRFVAEAPVLRSAAQRIGRLLDRSQARFEPALRTLRRARAIDPDVLHVHGIDLHLNLALLRLHSSAPSVLHFHGGFPAANGAARAIQRFNLGGIDRFLFTTREHARPFLETGLIWGAGNVIPFMELSSPFAMRSRHDSRRKTGMHGRPVFVWTGRLHPVKDPITVLRGFELILGEWREAALYMFYRTAEAIEEVRSFLDARPAVRRRVDLRGGIPHSELEDVYNSADFFLQASRREFSGCAVLEALSCGVVPVVTDIPSFRAMTGGGVHGVLFPVGDAEALARGVLGIPREAISRRARAARAYFDESLSYDVLGKQLDTIYRDLASSRTPLLEPR